MIADAVSFLAAGAALLAAGPFAQAPRRGQNSFWKDLGQGLRYVRGNRVIVGILSTGIFLNFVAAPLLVYFAPLARSLRAGAQGHGWLIGTMLLGFAIGAILLWL